MALRLALALVAAACAQPALAQTERYVPPAQRTAEPARPLAVVIAQEELATSIQLGRIVPNEGGLIGAVTNRRPEILAQNAAAKAHGFAAPLLKAMAGFEARDLALAATERVLAQTPWLGSTPPQVYVGKSMAVTGQNPMASRGDSTVSMTFEIGAFASEANDTVGALSWNRERGRLEKEFAAAQPGAKDLAIISWRYQVSPDFTNVQVIADVSIRSPGAPQRSYEQQFISLVKLRRPSFVEEENVAIWAANDGAVAREALRMAFARVGETLPAVLALDKLGYANAIDPKRNPRATGGNFSGPQLLRDDKGPVFFAKDSDQRLAAFVAVQTIDN
jgi:hypothetical protein